jgi:hypothetical protein
MTDFNDIPPEVRVYLDEVAQRLRALNQGEPIPDAWLRYLRKPAGNKRGRPKTEESRERHETVARKVFAMKMRGMSWEEIASAAYANHWPVTDPRGLQRIDKEYLIKLAVEEIRRLLTERRLEEERRSRLR